MPYGYNGKILHVNLTDRKTSIEEPNEVFYRRYMGGSGLGAYYCLRDIPPKADPLGPDNVIVFAPSVITGAPVPFLSRFNITAKSPLTNGIGDSQAGGYWGPELKFAGYDAIVIRGKSEKPVYLWINNGKVEIRDASHAWGLSTGEAERVIKKELDDDKVIFAIIGQGGENQVRYACVVNERKHVNGRTGMGAVMGSKNLKAIAVKGDKSSLEYFDKEKMKDLSKLASEIIKENSSAQSLREFGTGGGLPGQQETGGLPTRNHSSGVFDGYENITGQRMAETILKENGTCYVCPIRCKRVVEAKEPYEIDPDYGGPEYETLSALGSYLCIDDLITIAKGNELCNKYSLDTISTGASIAFAMECYENGILTKEDTGGLELNFGNREVLIELIDMIAKREGIGDLLADGPDIASKKIGKDSYKYAIHVKGNPVPAHMARVKQGLGLIYAVNPFGADHMQCDHDILFEEDAPEVIRNRLKAFGLQRTSIGTTLDTDKVRMMYYTQLWRSVMDTLEVCMFGFGTGKVFGMEHLVPIVEAITGWDVSSWELMKVGERRLNLLRLFNEREGFTSKDDQLPDRFFEKLREGPSKGFAINTDDFNRAKDDYYQIAGWDSKNGNPTLGKLKELDMQEFLN